MPVCFGMNTGPHLFSHEIGGAMPARAARERGRSEAKSEAARGRKSELDEGNETEGGDVPGLLFPDVDTNEAYVILKRRDDVDKTLVYHGRLSVEEATEERIATLFGGGAYIAQLRLKNENGKWVFGKQASFRIEGAYRKPSQLPGQVDVQDNPPTTVGVVGPSGEVTDARSVLETAVVSQLIDMMKTSKEIMSRPAIDWASVLAAATPIIVAFLSRKRESEISPAEIADQITKAVQSAVQSITAPAQPVNVISQLVEAFKAMQGMNEIVGGGRGSGDPLLDSIPQLAEVLATGMRQQREGLKPPALPAPSATQPGEVWQRVLQQHGATLVRFAAMRASPAWAAESAIVLMPPDIQEAMTVFLFREDVLPAIISVVPRLGNYQHWLAKFVNEARQQLADTMDGDGEEVGEGDESAPEGGEHGDSGE